jgi:hypothetical protein
MLSAPREIRSLSLQHADSDLLEVGHHANGVVIAEHAIDRTAQVRASCFTPSSATSNGPNVGPR